MENNKKKRDINNQLQILFMALSNISQQQGEVLECEHVAMAIQSAYEIKEIVNSCDNCEGLEFLKVFKGLGSGQEYIESCGACCDGVPDKKAHEKARAKGYSVDSNGKVLNA